MICPRDSCELQALKMVGVEIDMCPRCNGTWLDELELEQITRARGELVTLHLEGHDPTPMICPRCHGGLSAAVPERMPEISVAECCSCRGLWMDGGRLVKILGGAWSRAETAAPPRRRPPAPPERPIPAEPAASPVATLAPPLPAAMEESAPPAAELVAGRFELQQVLLDCRFSTLFSAVDRQTGQPCVIRRMDRIGAFEMDLVEEARLQTLQEAHVLSHLSHRNLPRVLEVVEVPPDLFLLMDDFGGQTLESFVAANGPLQEGILVDCMEQLLSVAAYLHSQDPPIVHRDLRPDTVLVSEFGTLKIGEFGLARVRETAGVSAESLFRSAGSAVYAPPEQILGDASTPSNDLYAIGAMLYFAATGASPPESLQRLAAETETPGPRVLRPGLGEALERLIMRLMEPDAEVRPGAVPDLQDLLLQVSAPPSPEAISLSAERPVEAGPTPEADPFLGRLRNRVKSSLTQFLRRPSEPIPSSLPSGTSPEDLERFPLYRLEDMLLDREVCCLLPEQAARSIQGICIERVGDELTVAVEDPTQVHAYDYVSLSTQGRFRARLVRAEKRMIDLARDYVYRAAACGEGFTWLQWLERRSLDAEQLLVHNPTADVSFGADDIPSPIIEAVDRLLKEAISSGASDIHLETFADEVIARYRVDGVLHAVNRFSPEDGSGLIKRLKILANMDIAKERVTQGGRISVSVAAQELDMRVSIVPVRHGECAVLRLLRKGSFNLTLDDLGFDDHDRSRLENILRQPYGMILVSGPTGSGKSTTLYAGLSQLKRPDRKLLTVEDPVEYEMSGITQVQVNMAPREEDQRVTFAGALREFLRQDPDVILVGEIRDRETAAISVQAALTGHLLLSTIHTNDSIGIVARLRDMGIEPYLIGSTLIGGVAQRLARRICQDCVAEAPLPDRYRAEFEGVGLAPDHLFRGSGCRHCHGTGYRGRVGLYEVMEVDGPLRELISAAAPDEALREASDAGGTRSLYADGLHKAARGLVTLDEVQRVCMTL